MAKPNRLTIRHITNMTDAVDDLVRLLGSWSTDEYFVKGLKKLLENPDKVSELHQSVRHIQRVSDSWHDIEIN